MKGISPLVATVLLIAFTIGVGGLISIFVTGLTTTSTGITSNQSEGLTKCAGTWINVYRVTNTTIFYTNPTSETIIGLTAVFSDGKKGVTILDQSLAIGESNFTDITNSTSNNGAAQTGLTGIKPGIGGAAGNTSVSLRGLCQSAVTAEGKCKQGQACWEA